VLAVTAACMSPERHNNAVNVQSTPTCVFPADSGKPQVPLEAYAGSIWLSSAAQLVSSKQGV
jgi:hypothetical protein